MHKTFIRWALAAGFLLTFGCAAGWAQGRKPNSSNCDLPAGQAKKHGCYGGVGSGHKQRSRQGAVNRGTGRRGRVPRHH